MTYTSASVFCAACAPTPAYRQLAYETGRELARLGLQIVSAGGTGMMDAVCQGAFEAGGSVRGLRISKENDAPSPYLSSIEYFPDFASRHQALMATSDVFVVLPGGIGTVVEALTITQLKRFGELPFATPLIFVGEYYRSLITLLEQYKREGFVQQKLEELYSFVESPNELRTKIPEILKLERLHIAHV